MFLRSIAIVSGPTPPGTGVSAPATSAAEGAVPHEFAESTDPDRLVPIVTAPDRFVIAVAGDPNRANAYVMSNDGPHGYWTSKPIDRSYSEDLVCRIDDREACKPAADPPG